MNRSGRLGSVRLVHASQTIGAALVLALAGIGSAGNVIDLGISHQTIAGFGGINYPRWIDDLTPDQVDLAFGNGPRQLGFTLLRIGIAPDSAQWGLELPTARHARGLGAKIFASPWSPPASMKTSDTIVKGELRESAYAGYARHLARFAGTMADSGAPLDAISLQNEPDLEPDYEGCGWTPLQLLNFLRHDAGSIPTRIIASESMSYDKSYTDSLLNDSAASANLDIVGVHLYDAVPSPYPLAASKGKELWMTEHYTSSDRSANLWPDALEVGKEIHACMASGFSAYVWWYIRRFYGPVTDSGVVSKRGWNMAHFSKFVRPGFVRVEMPETPAPGVLSTAYRQGDRLVLVAINTADTSVPCSFALAHASRLPNSLRKYTTSVDKSLYDDGDVPVGDGSFQVNFAAQSITTLATTDELPTAGSVANGTTGFVPGDYLVFGTGGQRVGVLRLESGGSLERQVRRFVHRSGIFYARRVDGDAVLRVRSVF